jgi:cysteine peptidase C11 family protein
MPDTPKPLKDWAVYVYFSADVPEAGSRNFAIKELVQMAGVGSSSRVYVAAQMNLPGKVTRRYILPEVPAGLGPLTISPAVSGTSFDLRSLTNFIEWSAVACPAEKTLLVLWGHGYGIDDFSPPGLPTRTDRQGIQALEMVAPRIRTPTKTDLIAQVASLSPEPVAPHVLQAFSLLPQFSFGTNPTNAQVGASVEAAFPSLPGGKKPAILGMASCEMAMAEAWCELADCAEIGLASQTPVPYRDWPMGPILQGLEAHPEADATTTAKMITEAFVQSYAGRKDDYVAISAVELPLIGSLTEAIKPLALALTQAASIPEGMENIFEARNNCPIYDPDGFIDLGSFCEFLKITLPKPDVTVACDRTIEALKKFVVDTDYSPKDPTIKLSQSSGLSVWFPSWIQFPSVKMMEKKRSMAYLRKGYPETRFALSTGWNKFLVTIRDAAAEARRHHPLVSSSQ